MRHGIDDSRRLHPLCLPLSPTAFSQLLLVKVCPALLGKVAAMKSGAEAPDESLGSSHRRGRARAAMKSGAEAPDEIAPSSIGWVASELPQ